MASDDPDFELKTADIIGLYVKPPQHAAVFAWTKRPPSKPSTGSTRCSLSPGRLERHGFEYYRY